MCSLCTPPVRIGRGSAFVSVFATPHITSMPSFTCTRSSRRDMFRFQSLPPFPQRFQRFVSSAVPSNSSLHASFPAEASAAKVPPSASAAAATIVSIFFISYPIFDFLDFKLVAQTHHWIANPCGLRATVRPPGSVTDFDSRETLTASVSVVPSGSGRENA